MRTRLFSWAAVAGAASAAVGVNGQQPAPAKFYPTQVTPAATYGSPVGRTPAGQSPSAQEPRNTQHAAYNGPPSLSAPPQYAPPDSAAGRPRLTQPVVAGPDGVRPLSAVQQASYPVLPAVGLPTETAKPNPADAPLPLVTIEPPDAPGVLPTVPVLPPPRTERNSLDVPPGEPAPQVGSIGVVPTPPPVMESSVLPPAAPAAALPPNPFPPTAAAPAPFTGGALPAKQTPNVEVAVVAPESVGVGMPLTYELVVRNVGTVPVSNVRVEDETPARSTLVGTEPPAETTGDRLGWTLGSLDAGAERRIKVTVKFAEEGEIRNRATVSFAAAVDARVRVTRPRVTVAVVGPEAGTARVGERVPFQLRLTNSGSGPATRVVLQARFSDGLIHPHGALIEAELANLQAGQTKTITLEATAAKAGGQTCTITASADGNPNESARSAVHLVEPLLVMRQTGPTRCLVKGEPAYSIELANPGTATTDPISVWSAVPEGFEFVQASDGGAFNPSSRTVGWRLPGLPANQTRALSLKLRAVGPADGVIRTTAQAAMPGTDPTANATGVVSAVMRTPAGAKPLEARAETAVKAEGVPALRFDVSSAEGVVEVGKEAVYEIRVVNQGTGPCTGVQVVADLADGTAAAGASGPSTARGSGQQVVFDPLPQLGVRQEVAYRVRVKGGQPGDMRFRVRLTCNEVRTPTVKEENTRFFKE